MIPRSNSPQANDAPEVDLAIVPYGVLAKCGRRFLYPLYRTTLDGNLPA